MKVELMWLIRYLLPSKVIVDWDNKFLAEFKTMSQAYYGVKVKPITSRNPQANFILERVHQIIGNIICTFKVQDMVLNNENPWDGILAFTIFALHLTIHIIT